jgi:GTP-binding protein HflX
LHSTDKIQETAVLIGVITKNQTKEQSIEYLDELEFLTETAGAKTLKKFVQKLDRADSKTFVGSGKMQEIEAYVKEYEVDMVIFDDDLSPSQLRNIEKILDCKILDRSNLILDIFAARAQTAHAKTQVELAQYEYLLPRLTRMWTHLQKQKGGIGMKGPGETEIETDRRIIRDKISLLKKKLANIDKQMATQRGNRGQMVRVALVGYTNAGKSTIMNVISKSKVFAEDKLFATLDTTVRKVVLQNIPFLLSDTVGFIRKLPHQLVESFKSTLDEVREADILLHVVDITHPHFEEHIEVVNETLKEIGAADKPIILVFNKIDAFTFVEKDEFDLTPIEKENYSLGDLKETWMAKNDASATLFLSAITKENIEDFRELLYQEVKKIHSQRYPFHTYLY